MTSTAINLDNIVLKHGAHEDPEAGLCAMEAVAYLAGEPHSDRPKCACPILTTLVMRINDRLRTDEERNELLKPFLQALVGSKSTREVEIRRARIAADYAVRVFAPMAIRLRGYPEHAARLEAVTPLVDKETADAAYKVAVGVKQELYAAAYADAYADAAYAAYAAAYAAAAAYAYADAAYADAADAAFKTNVKNMLTEMLAVKA